jgi:mono/diheme cytochrome c family protein
MKTRAVSRSGSMVTVAGLAALFSASGGCAANLGDDPTPLQSYPSAGGQPGPTATGGTFGSTGVAGATTCSGMSSVGPSASPLGIGGSGVETTIAVPSKSQPALPQTPVSAIDPPPPLSGGTLIVLPDGHTAVASDPDRDSIWVVDLGTAKLAKAVSLNAHDEPGRLVADAAGHVHVVLRRGGAIATIDPIAGSVLERRAVCSIPRGIAYDGAHDVVWVACMGGELVELPAAGGAPTQTFTLPTDLRDVVVDGARLYVSRFRTAQVLIVDPGTGAVASMLTPPAFTNRAVRDADIFTASTAWRMLPAHGGGALLLHQRGDTGVIVAGPGGYGSPFGSCASIVHPCVTPINATQDPPATPAITGVTLAIDFAQSADGSKTAIVAAGNALAPVPQTLFVAATSTLAGAADPTSGCVDGSGGLLNGGLEGSGGAPGAIDGGVGGADGGAPASSARGAAAAAQPTGEVTAVAFDGQGRVVVQTREPATLQIPEAGITIAVSSVSRADSGHAIFHADAGGGIACASCHGEGQDDGRTWQFDCLGTRRTMNLRGGIKGRAPYHWSGDLATFGDLLSEVYVGRMSGQALSSTFSDATLNWMDAIPRLPAMTPDAAAVERGQALFSDRVNVGCATCHTGAQLTTNAIVDVGTGGKFKVPSLTGVAWQAPYMHDGCASTLADRFSAACGGGDAHGVTSTLTAPQISDLVAYLQTL